MDRLWTRLDRFESVIFEAFISRDWAGWTSWTRFSDIAKYYANCKESSQYEKSGAIRKTCSTGPTGPNRSTAVVAP